MIKTINKKRTGAKVLVTDGDQRSTLALVRSLGSRGIDVAVAEDRPSSLASRSRYCAHSLVCPSAANQPTAFSGWLEDEVATGKYELLIPMTDITSQLANIDRARIGKHTRIILPESETLAAATDKGHLLELADQLGIPVPKSYHIEDRSQVVSVLQNATFPLVVKQRRSAIIAGDTWIRTGVEYCQSVEEVIRLLDRRNFSEPPLIQERVVGAGVGAFYLFDHGRKVASFFHRRLREFPISGGVSVLRESVPVDATVDHHATRLLEHLSWHGVAMVEFKHDERSGQAMLMEINARFWGSLQLAIDAGVDFPHLLYQLETSGSIRPVERYRVGLKSRWLIGDLNHLLNRLFKSDAALNLPQNYPGRLATIWEFLKFCRRGMKHEVFRFNDINPACYESFQFLKSLGGNFFSRWRSHGKPSDGKSGPPDLDADKSDMMNSGDN